MLPTQYNRLIWGAINRYIERSDTMEQKKKKTERIHNENGYYTLDEIARMLGISRERVRQIERSALRKLKHPKIARELRDYLEHG